MRLSAFEMDTWRDKALMLAQMLEGKIMNLLKIMLTLTIMKKDLGQ